MKEYCPKKIEDRGIKKGEDDKTYSFNDVENEKKIYILDMFPYPSGSGLHVGHLKGYLATDILTRYYTMKGYLVFHPMGWDSFGLPAEQYAIKTGNSPAKFTQKNIENFRNQLKRLMLSYDFRFEIDTSSPEYYRNTQGIFSEMYKKGLASLVDTQVNGCEELNTVLSDEEIVEESNRLYSERGHFPVVRKNMKQWILKITEYADKLLDGIDDLDGPDNVKKIQKEGIGKSFKYEYLLEFNGKTYSLFLNYASSIRRLKGIGIHKFSKLFDRLKLDDSKFGNMELISGIQLTNTVDFSSLNVYYLQNVDFRSEDLIPLFNEPEEAFYDEKIEQKYLKKENAPKRKKIYKLKDGVFSRQRFGGEPIPILFDEEGNIQLDTSLPVVLPDEPDYKSKRNGKSPLSNDKKGLFVNRDNKQYIRESNTMPNGAGSSGYFLAFLLKKPNGGYHNIDSVEAKKIFKKGLPVDIYVGGQEHASMHLLYARFWHKFLNRMGIVGSSEPFKKLVNQGMVLGKDGTKMSKSKGNYVSIDEIVDKYGADTLRVYEAFSGPTQLQLQWDNDALRASHKWLHRVYVFFQDLKTFHQDEYNVDVMKIENEMVKNFETAIQNLKVNLGISEMMIFLNKIKKLKKYSHKSLCSFLKILSFYAPALSQEIGNEFLKIQTYVFHSHWPEFNVIKEDTVQQFKVFGNGAFQFMIDVMEDKKMRDRISYELNIDKFDMQIIEGRQVVLISTKRTKKNPFKSS